MLQENPLVTDAAVEELGEILAAIIVEAQFQADVLVPVYPLQRTAAARCLLREHHDIVGLSFGERGQGAAKLIQVYGHENPVRPHSLPSDGIL